MKTLLFTLLLSYSLVAQDNEVIIRILKGTGVHGIPDTVIYYLISSEGDTLLSNEGDTLQTKTIHWVYENFNNNNAVIGIESGTDLRCWADKRKHIFCSDKSISTA